MEYDLKITQVLMERYEPDDVCGRPEWPNGQALLYSNDLHPGGYIVIQAGDDSAALELKTKSTEELEARWRTVVTDTDPSQGSPDEEDWVIETRGSWYLVRQERFKEWDEAIAYIVRTMREENFYPPIWHLSDHGNFRMVVRHITD